MLFQHNTYFQVFSRLFQATDLALFCCPTHPLPANTHMETWRLGRHLLAPLWHSRQTVPCHNRDCPDPDGSSQSAKEHIANSFCSNFKLLIKSILVWCIKKFSLPRLHWIPIMYNAVNSMITFDLVRIKMAGKKPYSVAMWLLTKWQTLRTVRRFR